MEILVIFMFCFLFASILLATVFVLEDRKINPWQRPKRVILMLVHLIGWIAKWRLKNKAIAVVLVVSIIVSTFFFFDPGNVSAATYTFVQTDWSGGVTANNASHSLDQTGWTEFSASSTPITIGAEITLTASTTLWTVTDDGTTGTGFNNTGATTTQAVISGTGASAGVKLYSDPVLAHSFSLKWGSAGTGASQFSLEPREVAVDSSGNVYVSDTTTSGYDNHRIQKFDSTGNFIEMWGWGVDTGANAYEICTASSVPCQISITGSGDGQFNGPAGLAVDSSDNVYVVDFYNHRIQKFNSNGSFITKWGTNGSGDGQFANPYGIAIDSSGSVYVSDENNSRIQKFNSNGSFITKWGTNGSGDGQFINPEGIAIDSSDNVYVVEDSGNQRVQKFSSSGTFITKWGSAGSFNYPPGLAVDALGYVYVADKNNSRVQKFDSDGNFITKWGSHGTGDEQFQYPRDVGTDASGNVYVTDSYNSRVVKYSHSPYASSGTFTSHIYDTTTNNAFGNLSWSADTPAGTSVTMKVRSGSQSDLSDATAWGSCAGVTNGADISANGCVTDGDRYIQWQASLSTTDTAYTPTLNDVSVEYAEYPASETLTSSAYDASDNANVVGSIAWTETLPSGTDIKFQIRTAPDSLGSPGTWTSWLGPTGTGDYYTDSSGNETINSTHTDGTDDQWMQYKVWLEGGTDTPTLSDTTLTYVVNAPPDFDATYGTNGVSVATTTASQIDISYKVRDSDTSSGSPSNQYKIWPSFEYSLNNGSTWTTATSTYFNAGDYDSKTVAEVAYNTYTASWNAKSQIGATYSTTTKIRVTADDHEAANNTTIATSSVFTLDTTNPANGTPTGGGTGVNVNQNSLTSLSNDKTATTSTTLYLSASDDSSLQMISSENSDFSGASWTSYSSTSAFTLTSGDGVKTVYEKFKDSFGNESATTTDTITLDTTAPATPSNMFIQDISNADTGEYRMFVNWAKNAESDWVNYKVYRSTNGTDFSLYSTITDIDTNYLIDTGLSSGTTYYYKLISTDDASNTSSYSSTVSLMAGSNPSDVVGPSISSISVDSITPSSVTITWTTNEVANSDILYSTDTSYANTQGATGYVTSHSIVMVGLNGSTTYNYKIRSCDGSSNCTTSSADSFTTSANDTTAPTITSGPTASDITEQSATISWSTNESSSSYVEYSTTNGFSSGLIYGTSNSVTSHSVTLPNSLSSGTQYYYKVRSEDILNNEVISSQNTFTTTADSSDATAPSISDVASSDIQYNTATITWTTDELATSYVEFGTTTSYGRVYGLSTLATSHSITLPLDLTPSTTYNYRVRSQDASANEAISSNATFITGSNPSDATAPVISDISISTTTPTSVTISWTTDEVANSYVGYSEDKTYNLEQGVPTMATSHSVILRGLTPATQYYAKIKSTDPSGNLQTDDNSSNGYSFSTAASGSSPPIISDIQITGVTSNTATVAWTTDKTTDSLVEYGFDTSYGNTIGQFDSTTSHSVDFPNDLLSDTTYYFRIRSTDSDSNEAISQNYTFTTETLADSTAPTISDVATSSISLTGATITWTTDEASNSLVDYGTTSSYGTVAGNISDSVTSHSIILSNLSAGATYYFQVRSRDTAGNLRTDDNSESSYTFTTTADTTNPTISDIQVFSVDQHSATITWTTDEATTSQVEYGTTDTYGSSTTIDSDLGTSHIVPLTSLNDNINYHFRVKSKDSSDNETISSDYDFTTLATSAGGGGGDIVIMEADKETPIISNIDVESIDNQCSVTWITNEKADSFVEYGTIKNNYTKVEGKRDAVISHKVIIPDLKFDTEYFLRITSSDLGGNLQQAVGYSCKMSEQENDSSPPEITDIDTQTVTINSAFVVWSTNEPATSVVEYGATNEYGNIKQDDSLFKDHIIKLTDLEPSATYHFRVKSTDSMGNTATSPDFTITTPEAKEGNIPPILAKGPIIKPVTSSQIIIEWITDKRSSSIVEFWPISSLSATLLSVLADSGQSVGNPEELTIEHSVTLTNLVPDTEYRYRVKSKDIQGNITISEVGSLKTGKLSEIYEVKTENSTFDSIDISWKTTNVATSRIDYGLSADYPDSISEIEMVKKHKFSLRDLLPNRLYHYRIRGEDGFGNILQTSDWTFVTSGPALISDVTLLELTEDSATITWTTDKETDSKLKYTNTKSGVEEIKSVSAFAKFHSVNIMGLEGRTPYTYQIIATDVAGNESKSNVFSFITPIDESPPQIIQVQTQNAITQKGDKIQSIISWITNEPSTTQVFYQKGLGGSKQISQMEFDKDLVTKHIAIITDFLPATVYKFYVQSQDLSGNTARSKDYTILTPQKKETVMQVILKNFEQSFSFLKQLKF